MPLLSGFETIVFNDLLANLIEVLTGFSSLEFMLPQSRDFVVFDDVSSI